MPGVESWLFFLTSIVALGKLLNLSEFSSLVCEMQRLLIFPIHRLVVRFNLINRWKAAKTVHDVPLVMWASTVFIYRHRWCIQVACSTDSQRNACLAKVLVWSPYVGSVLSSLPNFYSSLSVVSVPFTYFHWPSCRRRLKFVHNLCYRVINLKITMGKLIDLHLERQLVRVKSKMKIFNIQDTRSPANEVV